MHYLPSILNRHKMFWRLNTVMRDKGDNLKLANKIDRFLYSASCVLECVHLMDAAEAGAINLVRAYIKQIKFPKNGRITLATESLFQVYAQIPACVSSIVVMQDLMLGIFQNLFGIKSSVPSSFSDAMKAGARKYGFDDGICELLEKYWDEGGQYIRNVRHINEHYATLVNHSFFERGPDSDKILIFFPDNPETKSPESFTYLNENNARDVIVEGLCQIATLMDKALEALEIVPTPFSKGDMRMNQLGSMAPPQNRTLGLMINIENIERTADGRKLTLDALEIMQVIPNDSQKGNIALRKLKTDSDIAGKENDK